MANWRSKNHSTKYYLFLIFTSLCIKDPQLTNCNYLNDRNLVYTLYVRKSRLGPLILSELKLMTAHAWTVKQ